MAPGGGLFSVLAGSDPHAAGPEGLRANGGKARHGHADAGPWRHRVADGGARTALCRRGSAVCRACQSPHLAGMHRDPQVARAPDGWPPRCASARSRAHSLSGHPTLLLSPPELIVLSFEKATEELGDVSLRPQPVSLRRTPSPTWWLQAHVRTMTNYTVSRTDSQAQCPGVLARETTKCPPKPRKPS